MLFFKKGKFYELYEKDAGQLSALFRATLAAPLLPPCSPTLPSLPLQTEIGNREFNLKITDRVNMAVRVGERRQLASLCPTDNLRHAVNPPPPP